MASPVTLKTDAGEEHLDLVELELRVRRGEVSPQSLVRLPAVTGEAFVPACQLEIYQRLHRPKVAHFSRAFSLTRFPWLTSAIVFANVVIFLLTANGGELSVDDMIRLGAKVGPLIFDLGEFWRLFTANFLHRDALHLGLNLFVLFNVGGALENTYRRLDYVWLLIFSGVATMATSLVLNDAITIGSSGVVFGCLGGVVAFGLKYRNELPSRYRSILGEAAIPTVLGLLLIGVTSRGVDTWAHVGGLVAGMAVAAFMRPKLLTDPHRLWWEPALRAAPTLGILAVVFLGQQMFFGTLLPSMRGERDDIFGLVMPVPVGWREGANPLGSVARYNGLSGQGRASFAAEAVEMPEGGDAQEQLKRFREERLAPPAVGPDVLSVSEETGEVTRVGDRDALQLKATIEQPEGKTRLMAWFVPRGSWVYQLVYAWPADKPKYAQVGAQMIAGMRFVEPRGLRIARAQALLFPNSPHVLARLGAEFLQQGEAMAAADALAASVRELPDAVETRVLLAKAYLVSGDIERACAASSAAMAYAPQAPAALEVQARCELGQGHPRRALQFLEQASLGAPRDERLKTAVGKLRATLPELEE